MTNSLSETIAREEAAFDEFASNSPETYFVSMERNVLKQFLRESLKRTIREAFQATGVDTDQWYDNSRTWRSGAETALAAIKERQSAYLGDV